MLSHDETSFTHYTHYICCCSENTGHICDCTFDGMVEVLGNRYGNAKHGGIEGSGICPWCEVDFEYEDTDDDK